MAKLTDVFSSNLARALADRGAKSRFLKDSGISPSGLRQYLDGDSSPSLDMVQRIADALGVPVSCLLEDHSDDATIERFSREWNALRIRAEKLPEVAAVFEKIDGILKMFLEKAK